MASLKKVSFQYRGRDKRGVSRWSGSWNGVLRWLGIGFICYACLAGTSAIGMLLHALITGTWPPAFNTMVFVGIIHSLTFGGIGGWALWMRRRILKFAPADQVATRFGVDAERLAIVAQERDIKPRININGVDYYAPEDFNSDAVALLRGATQPGTASDTLLRAADSSQTTPQEELLRVPNGISER